MTGCLAFETLFLQPFFERIIVAIRNGHCPRRVLRVAPVDQRRRDPGLDGVAPPGPRPGRRHRPVLPRLLHASLGLPEPLLRATDVPCSRS
jgi:hypothetical protein